MALDWNLTNLTTTDVNTIDYLSTLLYFSTIETDNNGPPPPDPKGPKGPKGPEPSQHSELLEWKQTLAIISIITISLLIILALLQIKIHKECFRNFKQAQFSNTSGKTLFILFIIGLLMFYINIIVFVYFIFNFESLSEDAYAHNLIFSMIPYRIGKWAMSMFFILRLHFVFKTSALKINEWILWILITLTTISTILGCSSGIAGPLKLIYFNPETSKGINPALSMAYSALGVTIFVDIVVMIYYIQRLVTVVIMQGEVSYISTKKSNYNTGNNKVDEGIELTTNTETKKGDGILKEKDDDENDEDDNGECQEEVIETTVHIDHGLVKTITKSTLLSLIGIITSFWLHLEMFVMAVRNDSDGVLFRAIASFDGAVNVICMYLVFAFAKPYYEIGCKWCHIGMSKCCVCVTKKAVLRAKEAES